MCLILLAWRRHPGYPLVLAANRDEFYRRPTLPAQFWESAPELLAGRDLQRGGSWLGMTRTGRLAMVTNIRQPHPPGFAGSRGHLVRDWLLEDPPAEELAGWYAARSEAFPPFNLIAGDLRRLGYFNNREERLQLLDPGTYALSNALLDTPWPKAERGRQGLERLLGAEGHNLEEGLFGVLADRRTAAEAELPDTGIGPDWERVLSALFIASPDYGTRCSTVLLVDAAGKVSFAERSFPVGRADFAERRYVWTLGSPGS